MSAPTVGSPHRVVGWLVGLCILLLTVTGLAAVIAQRHDGAPGRGSGVPAATAPVTDRPRPGARPTPRQLRLVSYYPADAPWRLMWQHFDADRTDADMTRIASLGANAVRVIVDPRAVGFPAVRPESAADLREFAEIAARHGLWLQLTTFDWWHDYEDVDGSTQWLTSLLADPILRCRTALFELQNEIDPSSAVAMSWSRTLLATAGTLLPTVPRTLTVRGVAYASLLTSLLSQVPAPLLDVVDVHLYAGTQENVDVLHSALTLARGRPVIVGEAGHATYGGDMTQQPDYYRSVWLTCRSVGIPYFMPWTFTDFDAGALRSLGLSAEQGTFGLQTVDGRWKPAAGVVREMFAA